MPHEIAQQTIDELDTIDDETPDAAQEAERLIIAFLRAEGHDDVADAFEAAHDRCGQWHA